MAPVTEHPMMALFDTQAKLACLQFRELELLQELLDICKAIPAQKAVIDKLIRVSPVPPISHLPNELLAQIFLILRDKQKNLAGISHHWHAVIMDIPSIWSNINLDLCKNSVLLKLHLERSCQAPLMVSLSNYEPELLDIVMPHANYWHTLWILGHAMIILNRISTLKFSSLEFLLVDLQRHSTDLLQTIHLCVPALKCLQLQGVDECPWASSLNDFSPPCSTPMGFIAAESLTKLSLKGETEGWEWLPDSIHFPFLESLALQTTDPMFILEAIMAPKLKMFEFVLGLAENPIHSMESWSIMLL
ncbi:hypothetical protein EDC04DRAFT_2896882 [Pisolithus marmoratus]|nr:hypothetical protein EDC04DRAFT_2896882 [Pisolithus marmoratus]